MKVLASKNLDRVLNFIPGDSLRLTYGDTRDTTLLTYEIEQSMTVDRVAVYELGRRERKALGMSNAIAGAFGKRTTD